MIRKSQIISNVKRATGIKIDMFRQTQSWVMVYDDPDRNIYETETVYVMWLSDMGLEEWIETATEFATKIENLK